MYPLLESIKISNNSYQNLEWHEVRMNNSLKQVYGVDRHPVKFDEIRLKLPPLSDIKTYKLRIEYGPEEYQYTIEEYILKSIKSIKLVDADELSYDYKYSDRSQLLDLYNTRGECDDILICRHGCLTDSYYCNIALGKNGKWFTPDLPLLPGTKRAMLIEQKQIIEAELYVEDITDFDYIRLFNALIEPGEIELPTSSIAFD